MPTLSQLPIAVAFVPGVIETWPSAPDVTTALAAVNAVAEALEPMPSVVAPPLKAVVTMQDGSQWEAVEFTKL